MSSLPPSHAGVGSAINDAARQIGAAAGVAVLGSVWASSYHHSLSSVAVQAQVPPAALEGSRSSVGAALDVARTLPPATRTELVHVVRGAFVHGSDVANLVAGAVALIGAALAFRYLPSRPPAANADEAFSDAPPAPESADFVAEPVASA